jgi:glycosyltransferase involved in cell wall biosynthesis
MTDAERTAQPSRAISAIMPARDAAATIQAALGSLAPVRDLLREILVVDDGSRDGTAGAASAFAARSGLPVAVLTTAHQGAAACRNLGMARSSGEFLFFVDADDEVDPAGLRGLYEATGGGDGPDLVIGAYVRREADRWDKLRIPHGYGPDVAANARDYVAGKLRSIAMGSALVRRSIAVRAGFPEGVVYDEDTIFWAAVLSLARVATLPDPVVVYNVDAAKMERRLVAAPHEAFERLKRGLDGLLAHGIDAKVLDRRKAAVAVRIARALIRRKRYSGAREFLATAASLDRGVAYELRTLRYLARVQAGRALSRWAAPPDA